MTNFDTYMACADYIEAANHFDKVAAPSKVRSGQCSAAEFEAAQAVVAEARSELQAALAGPARDALAAERVRALREVAQRWEEYEFVEVEWIRARADEIELQAALGSAGGCAR